MLLESLVQMLIAALLAAAPGGEDAFVPFVIPMEVSPESVLTAPEAGAIAPDGPRVQIDAGPPAHLRVGRERFRVWGVNLCFGACFPTHEQAERLAARLAAAGVNSVRFHHMDCHAFPRGIWDPKDRRRLSAEALDRLDYLMDQLARRGIYANINLHVSRKHSEVLGLPQADQLPKYDKVVDLFHPALISAQQRYARMLLGHRNPYRGGTRYADDSAIAFVEISNEDSFFAPWVPQSPDMLPGPYLELLERLYAAWLRERYGSIDALRAAWADGADPLGAEIVIDGDFRRPLGPESPWTLSQRGDARARLAPQPGGGARVELDRLSEVGWHVQLIQGGLALRGGQYYTLSFRVRADRARPIQVGIGQHGEPWRNLGLRETLDAGPAWRTIRLGFTANADEANARVGLALGMDAAAVELAGVSLRPGGRAGLGEDESLEAGRVELFGPGETAQRQRDRLAFQAVTERAYYDRMKSFLRDELGCGALITGSAVYGPLGLYGQGGMDYIDGHAYWSHPRFPGKPWDPNNWLIRREAMTDHPERATFLRLAPERLAGKPYTVSEYNHPAPNDYQAEAIPMIAAFAALQDWDGVWLFTYANADTEAGDRVSSFFDLKDNPAKWGFVRAGAAIFRDGGISSERRSAWAHPLTDADASEGPAVLDGLARHHLLHGLGIFDALADRHGLTWPELLQRRMYTSFGAPATDGPMIFGGSKGPTSYASWTRHETGHATFVAADGRNLVLTGQGTFNEGAWEVDIPEPAFVALTVTPLRGGDSGTPDRILIAASGRCENVNMGFRENRQTVGTDWGQPPVRIEAVRGSVTLPHLDGKWTCHALGPDGLATHEVPLTRDGEHLRVDLSPEHGTMWYLLERK